MKHISNVFIVFERTTLYNVYTKYQTTIHVTISYFENEFIST